MPIQQRPDNTMVVIIGDNPQLADELNSLTKELEQCPPRDVVLDMREVSYVNSWAIAKLLNVRKVVMAKERRLFLTEISTQVWGTLLATGLDKIFDTADDAASALTSLQTNRT